MVRISYDYSIEIVQGENGVIYFKSNDYKFKEGDKIIFGVFNDKGEFLFTKESTLIDNGLIYLELTENDIINLPIGEFLYSVKCHYDNDQITYLQEHNDIKIKEGIKW